MRIVALTILALAVIALVTGNLAHVLPSSRKASISSNGVEKVHSGLRTLVVIVAACAVAISAVVAYVVLP